jgi:hypothetical protein
MALHDEVEFWFEVADAAFELGLMADNAEALRIAYLTENILCLVYLGDVEETFPDEFEF